MLFRYLFNIYQGPSHIHIYCNIKPSDVASKYVHWGKLELIALLKGNYALTVGRKKAFVINFSCLDFLAVQPFKPYTLTFG